MMVSLIAACACTEDSFLTDLDNARLNLHDTTTTEIIFKTYQVPSRLGKDPRLYLGKKDNYHLPFSLLRLGNIQSFNDTIKTVDSAYVQITIDSTELDSSIQPLDLVLGYFDFNDNYSEDSTNYLNINWIPDSYPELQSTTFQDTLSNLQHIRFYVDSSLINVWADTSEREPLFILESTQELSQIVAFYSKNSNSDYKPFLKVFYQSDSVFVDTVAMISDVTVVFPPSLEEDIFDSTKNYAGFAAGLNTLLYMDIEKLHIPSSAVIIRANLRLYVDLNTSSITSKSEMKLRAFLLKDSVENWEWGGVYNEDIYPNYDPLVAPGTYSSSVSIEDSTLTLNLRDIFQSLVIKKSIDENPIRNFGLKIRNVNSASIFDYVAFYSSLNEDLSPRLEVLYEIP